MSTTAMARSLRGSLIRLLARDRNDEKRVRDLVRICLKALAITPPNYARSIFGPEETWLPPYGRFSEFALIDPRRPGRALQYVLDTSIPSLPIEAPACIPEIVETLFFRETEVIPARVDPLHPDEAWFFINGIMTNRDVARHNATCIRRLFGRPVTIIQNSTNGLVVDLVQCAIGKEWEVMTEPVEKALPAILAALRDPKKRKVVVIAHSQGTIITGDVLDILNDLVKRGNQGVPRASLSRATLRYDAAVQARLKDTRFRKVSKAAGPPRCIPFESIEAPSLEEMAKLEIFAFANCASRMTCDPRIYHSSQPPFIESFGNSKDVVARLGMFSRDRAIQIDGPKWERKDAWGHMLNEHYLLPIGRAKRGRGTGSAPAPGPFEPYLPEPGHPGTPFLFRYLGGGTAKAWKPRLRKRTGEMVGPDRREELQAQERTAERRRGNLEGQNPSGAALPGQEDC